MIARLRNDLVASLKHTKRNFRDDKASMAAQMFADGELFRSRWRTTGIETVRSGDVLCTCRASSISLTFPRSPPSPPAPRVSVTGTNVDGTSARYFDTSFFIPSE